MKARVLAVLVLGMLAVAGGALYAFLRRGVSARAEPWGAEALVARKLRSLAIPRGERARRNPMPPAADVLAEARAHFADPCAVCHANDGSGRTPFGEAMYPPPPDMREAATQSLSDGELFWIVRNGIRFTGMPAFGQGAPEADTETWALVHFIRRLPRLTEQEAEHMKALNPVSRKALTEEDEIRRFLEGGDAPPHD